MTVNDHIYTLKEMRHAKALDRWRYDSWYARRSGLDHEIQALDYAISKLEKEAEFRNAFSAEPCEPPDPNAVERARNWVESLDKPDSAADYHAMVRQEYRKEAGVALPE